MDEERSRRDRQLAARIRDGDPAALEALYDAYAGAIYRQALAIVGCASDAEDVLQDVYLKLVRRRGGPIQDVKAYLFMAARHQAYSTLRQRRREPRDSDLDIDAFPSLVYREELSETTAVQDALQALPSKQREVVLLKVYDQ